MKKALYATAGSALALILLAAAMPAKADVNVVANITKNKDITVTENITIHKTIDIVVSAVITPEAAAEAQALMNVTNDGAVVGGPVDQNNGQQNTPANLDNRIPHVTDFNIHLSAVMDGSGNGNTGVWGFNQDVGNMTNQGNVVSVAGITDLPSFADAQAEGDQSNTNNSVTDFEIARVNGAELGDGTNGTVNVNSVTADQLDANKTSTIQDSINGNAGVMNVNQNAGNMNNQTNGVAAAVGLEAQVAMSEGALGQTNSGNTVFEVETVKRGLIDNSVNGNTGIINVNQSNGNMNNQGNVVSLAATVSGAILGNASAGGVP
ncbi:hypothetical protein FRZ44_28340 [Hypericibacter terrae]|uniref:Adhesin n=1 Tax=Hypericibacter terrae TaxID=2602015 RepID=A0A5J6MJA3_9PROT|nr:hypothetical protein [Hypericibacter terrae]QEX17534.1 hypothetical protein FRZ44_28340 [Hypericibacter terrae]